MPGISASYHASHSLPDGRIVHLRAIRPGDQEKLRAGFFKLSKASVRDRFFGIKRELTPAELSYFTEIDFQHHVALVAELQDGSERTPVGVGRFVQNQDQPDHSEMAITVIDELQGQGIGSILLFGLVDCARKLGVRHLDATALAQNTRITSLMRKTGLPLHSSIDEGIRTLSLTL